MTTLSMKAGAASENAAQLATVLGHLDRGATADGVTLTVEHCRLLIRMLQHPIHPLEGRNPAGEASAEPAGPTTTQPAAEIGNAHSATAAGADVGARIVGEISDFQYFQDKWPAGLGVRVMPESDLGRRFESLRSLLSAVIRSDLGGTCESKAPKQGWEAWEREAASILALPAPADEPITEDWLRACGWRWEEKERCPFKHWILWLGRAIVDDGTMVVGSEDLGVEITKMGHESRPDDRWHVWVRADYCGRYTRFLHIRHMQTQAELARLIEGMVGRPFNPNDAMYGMLHTPAQAARLRADAERLDVRMARNWAERAERERGRPFDESEVCKISL